MKMIRVLLLLAVFFASGSSQASFVDGLKAYHAADYKGAQKAWQGDQVQTPYRNLNLAAAYFHDGQLAQARLHAEKAKRHLPRDPRLDDISKRLQSDLAIEGPIEFSALLDPFVGWAMTLKAWELQLLASLLLALLLYFWIRGSFRSPVFYVALFLAFYIGAGLWHQASKRAPEQFGIVISRDVVLKSSYFPESSTLQRVPWGQKVKRLDQQVFESGETWVKLMLPGGREGWVPETSLAWI